MKTAIELNSQPLVHNWNFARDFPSIDPSAVNRPYLLETIVDILSSTNPVVFLEGDEGDGATTTLAQFCQKYPDQTISLFIKPASRFAYNPDYLRLALAEQFHWIVFGIALDKPCIDPSEFNVLIQHVRKAKKATPLFFVIDGLHQIPLEDTRLVEAIFREVLPIGVDNFRFIITGEQSKLGEFVNKVNSKPYQQLKFSLEDTRNYLSALNLSGEDVSEIHKMCKSVPGRIAAVKRLITSGKDLISIFESEPEKYLEFIKLEFNSLDYLSINQQKIIANLVFSKQLILTDELLKISHAHKDELDIIIKKCTFLKINDNDDSIEFISTSHRKFAETRLLEYKNDALKKQVEHLLQNPSSDIALRFLPTYYQQLNQQQAIVDLLSVEHFTKLLKSTESIAALKNRAELGSRSAARLKQAATIFKFALQRSIFNAVSYQDVIESEVTALVALNQPQKALTLASSSVSKESRLSLLVTYTKRVKELHGTVDPELLSNIKELSNEINFSELGDQAINIASSVVLFDPDLAINIVEQAHKGDSDSGKKDAAFTHLSITTSLSKVKDRTQIDDRAKSRISDTALQKFANSISLLVESLTAKEIIETVEKMERKHRLSFIKIITSRRYINDIFDVVDYALDLIIKETTYTPKSRDLADLSIPLTYATQDIQRLKKLITRFETQVGLVAKSALSKDLVLLQMRIAQAELSFDRPKAIDRINQTYFEIASIKTPEIQTECYALMLNILARLDHDNLLEKEQGFRSVIQQELTTVLDNILANIADQTDSISGALRSLSENDCAVAMELASKLNTEDRRNKAYKIVIETISEQAYFNERDVILHESLNRITNKDIKSEAILGIVDAIYQNKDKAQWIDKISSLISAVETPKLACEFLIKDFVIRVDVGQNPDITIFKSNLHNLIMKVDSKLEIIDVYYKSVEALAKRDINEASQYYEIGKSLREDTIPNTEEALRIIQLCLSLISRSFGPLMKSGILSEDMSDRFSNLVEAIPCAYARAGIYSDLAIRAWCVNRVDLCKSIVSTKCRPLIEEAKNISSHLFEKAIQISFPAFFLSHSSSSLALLDHLSFDEADEALYDTATIIIRHLPPSDPASDENFIYTKLEHENVSDVLDILSRVNADNAFYWILDSLMDSLSSKSNTSSFTIQQKSDYTTRIQDLIPTKLPDKRNIQHKGYFVASIAQTYRLKDHAYPKWQQLENDARKISNIADQAYVLIEISKCMPQKLDSHKKRLLEEALTLIHQIPSPIDRLGHYNGYINAASKNSAASARATLKTAIALSSELDGNAKVQMHRRQLIDIADRIEGGLADKLIELIDDDPARANAKEEFQRSASLNKVKRDIANTKAIKDIKQHDSNLTPDAVWRNVASLLAGRLETKPVDVMAEYVLSSGADSLSSAYPALSWYIENAAKKFTSHKDVSEQILPVSEALLLSTEMTLTVLAQESRKTSKFSMPVDQHKPNFGTMVCAGDRHAALSFITSWLRANADEYIKYSDPFFGPDDVSFLRMVLSECPECRVHILTGKLELQKKGLLSADKFTESWKKISDQDPPETEIIAVGEKENDKGLIHDRWILSKGCGIRIGTSFNSIGTTKLSEISTMNSTEAKDCELELDKYINKIRTINGIKVSYAAFTL